MKSSLSSRSCIILDACCVINLYASGEMGEIIRCIPESIATSSYVKEREVLTIFDGPPDDVRSIRKEIDLNPFIESGLLIVAKLESTEEKQTYINLAYDMHDGEAMTGALAIHRDWALATDDRKVTNYFSRNAPEVPILSSLEIIKHWVDGTSPPSETVCTVLRNVRLKARYEPDRNHAFYEWWQENMEL